MSTIVANTLPESNAESITEPSKVDVTLAVIYGLMIAFLIFTYKLFEDASYTQHGGLGGVPVLIFFGGFLLISWSVIGLISSLVMIRRKKHYWVTMAILSVGAFVGSFAGLISIAILLYLSLAFGNAINVFTVTISIVFISVAFITGAGLTTFVIFAFDVILFIPKQIIKRILSQRENLL